MNSWSGLFEAGKQRVWGLLFRYPAVLARLGVVDRCKGMSAFDLAVPMVVTGFLRTILRTSDFFLVSLALGDTAVAALELGFQYYFLGFALIIGLSSGTISVVSRFVGAGDRRNADFAVKQSLWLALAISLPMTGVTWLFAEEMIAVLTNDPGAIALGGTYLRIVMLSLSFRYWSMVALRALQGAGDTRTPMYVRFVSIPTNFVLSAALIFGVGPFPALGIAGAAWGMTIANTLSSVIFLGVMLSGRFPAALRLRDGRWWDWGIARELVRVGYPVAGRQLAGTFGRFPFLFIIATLGTHVVAAYAIGRRILRLAMTPGGGFGTASSTLVGQNLGADEAANAEAYGWQVLRLALVTQVLIAALVVVFARPMVEVFSTDSPVLATQFVYVFAVSIVGFSVARTMSGGLQGAGDTTWPFYGMLLGSGLRLAIGSLALPGTMIVASIGGMAIAPGLGIGIPAVFAALVVDIYARAGVNTFRYWTGRWKLVARRSSVGGRSHPVGDRRQ